MSNASCHVCFVLRIPREPVPTNAATFPSDIFIECMTNEKINKVNKTHCISHLNGGVWARR